MNPYAATTEGDIGQLSVSPSVWPRAIDWICWSYPVVFALIAFGTTMLLRASSLSICPMQYDFYFEEAGEWQQFWYHVTLLLFVFAPLALLFSPLLQIAWSGRLVSRRIQFVGITVAIWICVPLFFAVADVPIVDYLID